MRSKKLIYQCKEFQELYPEDRALIILVSQKVKPYATLGSLKRIGHILEDLGLYFTMTKREKDFVYDITYKKKLFKELQGVKTKRKQDSKMSAKEWQKTNDHVGLGQMYGYPTCCTEAYTRDFKNDKSPLDRATNQYFRYFAQHGTISEEIHFVNYFPCSMDCKKTIELGRKNRETLEAMDTGAFLEYWESYVPIQELESCISNEDSVQKIKLEDDRICRGDSNES